MGSEHGGPVHRLDMNGLMFPDKIREKKKSIEEELVAEVTEEKNEESGDISNDLLDGFIAILSALRKRK